MKKRIIFFFFSMFFVISFAGTLDFTKDFYQDDPWGFIGQKFYDEPLSNYNKLEKKAFRLLVGIAGLVPSAGLTYVIAKKYTQDKKIKKDTKLEVESKKIKKKKPIRFIATSFAAYGGFAISYGMLNVDMKCRVDYSAFKNFIKNWKTYKELTPTSLHAVFQRIYVLYNKGGWKKIKPYTKTIVSAVRKKLARNDEGYGALYKINEDFFEAKHFVLMLDINIYELLRATWDVFLVVQGFG